MDREDRSPAVVLGAWGLCQGGTSDVPSGHINRTWLVEQAGEKFVLQWLNPVFAPELHFDIEAVTDRLESAGLTTPRLVRTTSGELWATDPDGGVWRLFTFVEGETLLTADSSERCSEAGRLVGEFHRALWDFEYEFRHGRFGVHDTGKHLAALERVLSDHRDHASFAEVEPLAQRILEAALALDLDCDLPERIVHGDPKISNVLFSPQGRAICLVDLDTLARMPIAVELGDAFRSWCNPQGEDVMVPFDKDFFAAGLTGYARAVGDLPSADERLAIPALVQTIAVELAARFCADALRENYFNWDRARYPSASAHNLKRARAQLALGESVARQMGELERIVRAAWR